MATTPTLDPLVPPTPPRSLPRALTPFRTPAYRRLAVVLCLIVFAHGAWLIGQVWEVIRLGGGPTHLSLVAAASALGLLAPALLAGVVADRVPQKVIITVVLAVEVAIMAVISVISLVGVTQLWHLAVAALGSGFALAFFYPAYSAWLPALVPEQDLLAVNGFEGTVRPVLGQALGPAVAGAVVGAVNPGTALLVATVAAALGLLALRAVPHTPVRRDFSDQVERHPVRHALSDIGEGFSYMVRTPWLLFTLIFACLWVLLVVGPIEVLIPFLVKDGLGGGAEQHAWVLASWGVGGAVGALAMGSMRMPRRYLTVMNLMWGVGCLPMVVMAFATSIWTVIAAGFVLGVMFSGPMVIWGTLLQRRVPPALLGRVSSLDFFVSLSLMPVSMALAGPVAEWIGLQMTFVIAGILPLPMAVAAIVLARMPADEIAHPLD
ncbi:MFS transporter [Nocardioides limicola]|uniref:MFS transporter n=1 Tax=Nocardioides limicola TaxID=2803368 RepID=UPI00193B2597|nr:MFS transporter [Nocardioides sp. DJM-14]